MKNNISENILISSGKFDKEKQYWIRKLSGDLSISSFSCEPAPPHPGNNRRAAETFALPPGIYHQLISISNSSQYGIFILLVTAIFFLLSKYTGNRDIIIGVPVIRGKVPGTYFNHIAAIRDQITGDMTFKDLLLRLKETVTAAYKYMNYPLHDIVKLLKLPVPHHRFPLFDTLVVLKNIHDQNPEEFQKCGTVFLFEITPEGITGEINYDLTSFEKQSIRRLSIHMINYFRAVTRNPSTPLSEIDILAEQEKRQILWEFNNTCVQYPKDKTVIDVFADQEKKNPHAAAVVVENRVCTYRELNKASNQAASMLTQVYGIRPGDIVGLYMTRSQEMIAGIIGVLKANATCMPIDLRYPRERIRMLLGDSQAKVLMKTKAAGDISNTRHPFKLNVIDIDSEESYPYDNPAIKGPRPRNSHQAAYVIYSSGSTGQPKGVLLRHYGITNHMHAIIKELEITGNDVFCHNLSFSYVVSIWQIFAPFYFGLRLLIYPEEAIGDPFELFNRARTDQVTLLEIVPSLLNTYLNLLAAGKQRIDLNRLRILILTGEEIIPSLVNRFYRLYSVQLLNAYGQSEYSDDTLYYRIPPAEHTTHVPVGKPSNNTCIYILDRHFQLQPLGVPGELFIWGDGLAVGYLNRVELTAEKFCLQHPGPHGMGDLLGPSGLLKASLNEPNRQKILQNVDRHIKHWNFHAKRVSKPSNSFLILKLKGTGKNYMQSCNHASMTSSYHPIFRTGDLARWQPDGNIQFLGRIDHQVKIRGIRVELGEIESLLLEHETIKEAAVITKEIEAGNPHLYAYIVPAAELSVTQLKAYLSNLLPDYMIPSYFIQLEEIPLLPNGKVNRQYLNGLKTDPLKLKTTIIAPKTRLEKIIARTWQEVLTLTDEALGTDLNFFELGGNSFDMLKINGKLEEALKMKIPVVMMFQYPTIRTLARHLDWPESRENISIQANHRSHEINKIKKKWEQRTLRRKGT